MKQLPKNRAPNRILEHPMSEDSFANARRAGTSTRQEALAAVFRR